VVQVYVENLDSSLAPLHPFLCGFLRIHLAPGEKKAVRIPVWENTFQVVDPEGVRKEEGKHFRFYAGISQPDARSGELTGKTCAEFLYERK
jgi:beta-glucosidase